MYASAKAKAERKKADAKVKKVFKKKIKKYAKSKAYKKAISQNKRAYEAKKKSARSIRSHSIRTQEYSSIEKVHAYVDVEVQTQVLDVEQGHGVVQFGRAA